MQIVVGVDGSDGSKRALAWAAAEARRWEADLLVMAAWSVPVMAQGPTYGVLPPVEELVEDRRQMLRELIDEAGLAGDDDIAVSIGIGEGSPAAVLLEAAEQADLLVVGARGIGGFKGLLLGSVSQHCAAHAPCPVVVVPRDQ